MESRIFFETVQGHVSNAKPFTVHNSFLIKVSWFDTCLRQPMEEGLSNVIKLPEDNPKVIEDFLGFLYLGRPVVEKYSPTLSGCYSLLNLYRLADRFDYEEVQNAVMDQFVKIAALGVPDTRFLRRVNDTVLADRKLHCFWATRLARSLRVYDFRAGPDEMHAGTEANIMELVGDGSDLVKAIFKILMSREDPEMTNKGDTCTKWHVHERSPKCKTGTAVKDSQSTTAEASQ